MTGDKNPDRCSEVMLPMPLTMCLSGMSYCHSCVLLGCCRTWKGSKLVNGQIHNLFLSWEITLRRDSIWALYGGEFWWFSSIIFCKVYVQYPGSNSKFAVAHGYLKAFWGHLTWHFVFSTVHDYNPLVFINWKNLHIFIISLIWYHMTNCDIEICKSLWWSPCSKGKM